MGWDNLALDRSWWPFVNIWRTREMHTNLLGDPDRERKLGRPSLKWKYNIKIDHKHDGRMWIGLI